jgi:HK97 family phage major capsid protein
MSLRKQIDSLQARRNKHLDAMSALAELAAGEDRLFSEDEQKAFDKDQGEVRDIDAQMQRLEAAEQMLARTAKPAPSPLDPSPRLEVKAFKPFPGQAFARYAATLARAKGNLMQAVELSHRFDDTTPEVGAVLRAAVAAGTTADPTWAGPLVNYTVMANEFIEFLRPMTLLGQITGMRPTPFMVKIPRQTAGSSAQWVGEGLSKPISSLAFDLVTLPFAKMAVISVITEELARLSAPNAEMLVRDDLALAIAQYMDQQFIDRSVAGVANLHPASITNGNHAIPSSGNSVAHVTADLVAASQWMTDANIAMRAPVWIMHNHARDFLYSQRTSIDSFVWKEEMDRGLLMGKPYVVSNNVPLSAGLSDIVLIDASEILLADDGQITLDASAEATLQMDSAPVTPPVAATVMISMWQQNMLAIKAERYIFWLLRRAQASVSITGFVNPAP